MNDDGVVGILGLARSGLAAARLARGRGIAVFASDAGDTPALRAAAQQVRELGGEAETGGHSIERLAACSVLVVSPGIASAGVLSDPRLKHVRRISELEFASRYLVGQVIAVTGTNGKTTTTALCAHLLRAGGRRAEAAGNIGRALSDVAASDAQPEWVVVEASSFQLAAIETFAPAIGVVTNLSPDHLDRYDSVGAYYADKARLFERATAESVWVLNGEDDDVLRLAGAAPGTRLLFRVQSVPEDGVDGGFVNGRGELVLRAYGKEHALVHRDDLKLLGPHNQANALAAALAARAAGVRPQDLRDGLRSFEPLEHRLEPVAEVDGVLWVNDSKATNLSSTRVALRAMDRPVVLLLGGRHKGEPYDALLDELRERAHAVVAYGEARERIVADLKAEVPVEPVTGGLDRVVAAARTLARPGDVVLLSPACSSYDMFGDYEERGATFKRLVGELRGADEEAGRA